MEVLDVLLHVGLAEVGARAALDDALEGPLARVRPLVTLEALLNLEWGRVDANQKLILLAIES